MSSHGLETSKHPWSQVCEFDHIRGGALRCSGTFKECSVSEHKGKCDEYLKC